MNEFILNTEIQEFIDNNINSNTASLLLKGTQFNLVKTKEIIEQIESKKRCEKKLPSWFNTKNIFYPNKLHIEQTSSEITAKYKLSIVEGEFIIDLTGGFGVDCFYFSKHFKTVVHCEINTDLSNIVSYNFNQLKATNIKTLQTDGILYLKQANKQYDWIYIDPSRRHDTKGKVFFLKDCLPNVPQHIELLFKYSKNIMIKTSPLLDISIGINELKYVKSVHVVAVNNEVKEVLWILQNNYKGDTKIETTNIKNNTTDSFGFYLKNETNIKTPYYLPLTYLYEPNSAILKAGGFNEIAKQLPVLKLHKHSHLYTSEELTEFPGRCFKIETVIPYNKKTVKKLGILKANITTRNFPETVQKIREKFTIKDGGDQYLFFTTDSKDAKIIIKAHKV